MHNMNKPIACIAIAAFSGVVMAGTTIVGGDTLNGNFNSPAGTDDVPFSGEPYWINIGTGDNSSTFLKSNEDYDGTRNAVLAESTTRLPGLDTGYSIRKGDIFSISYQWLDSFQWNDGGDQIKIRLFVTSDNTISGTPTDLVSRLSGARLTNNAYELVDQNNIYTATAADAGKALFVALDTQDGGGGEDGFARIDDFELSVASIETLSGFVTPSNTIVLAWDSIPGSYYTVRESTDLANWLRTYEYLLADSSTLQQEIPIGTNNHGFFQVLKEPEPGPMVDSATPRAAQPDLVIPTGDTWVLDFSDEFDSFDSTKWVKSVSTSSRAARPAQGIDDWWWRADHVSVANGKLELKISKPDYNTMYCGSVESRDLYETAYGFMEARINCSPIEKGAHTAFWLQGHNQSNVDGSGADGCEVDIFESAYGDGGINPEDRECQSVLHWDGYGVDKQAATRHWNADDVYTDYHTFALHWTPTFMDFYYDGVLQWRYDASHVSGGVGIPQVAEWLWLSVGASFGDGNFQTETYPSYSYVDYVRVWKSQ